MDMDDFGLPNFTEDKTKCPVCDGFKHGHEAICHECQEHKDRAEAITKNRRRVRAFGRIW